ncbi:MAG: hypothetical protein WCL14_08755 [Bacteroidota bacterium]
MGSVSQRAALATAKRRSLFAVAKVTYQKSFRGNLPSKHSPDSSGSPLLCVGNGKAAATADSGTHQDTRGGYRLQKRIKDEE